MELIIVRYESLAILEGDVLCVPDVSVLWCKMSTSTLEQKQKILTEAGNKSWAETSLCEEKP